MSQSDPQSGGPRPHTPRSAVVPALLAWLVPGAGHLRIGRPWPAAFVAAAVVPLFVLGMVLGGFENVNPERHRWYFATQVWAGIPAIAGAVLTREVVPTEPVPAPSVGALYTAVAGLLNLVAIADCWARCRRGDPEHTPEEAAPDTASRPLGVADLVKDAAGPSAEPGQEGAGG